MTTHTPYYIEIAISFIIIFILLYIAILMRRSSIKFDAYYKLKEKSIKNIDDISAHHQERLANFRDEADNEYIETYKLKNEKITNTLDELKGLKNKVNDNNTGGDANDN